MPTTRYARPLSAVGAVLLAGCAAITPSPSQPAVITGVGPGISIEEALTGGVAGPLLINGFVYQDADGELSFCTALGESDPPSCTAPSLTIVNLPDAMAGTLQGGGDVRWSEEVQLLGTVDGNTLEVATGLSP